jgi:hypothetical protein
MIIQRPMDLATIRDKLEAGTYELVCASTRSAGKVNARHAQHAHGTRQVSAFLDDVQLVWSNAKVYNPPGSDVVIMADAMEQETRRLAASLGLIDAAGQQVIGQHTE